MALDPPAPAPVPQGSYQATANQLCSMGSDLEDLKAELERRNRAIGLMAAQQADQATLIRAMEVKAIDEDIRKNNLILERDCALASLRRFQGCTGDEVDPAEALSTMTVELQRRDSVLVVRQLSLFLTISQRVLYALHHATRAV